MSRPSPPESATGFSAGTIKKGNDGNLWMVKLTKNLVHRWIKLKISPVKKKSTKRITERHIVSPLKKKSPKKSKSKILKTKSNKKTKKSKSKKTKKSNKKTKKSNKKTKKSKSKILKTKSNKKYKKKSPKLSSVVKKFNKKTFKVMLAQKYTNQNPVGYWMSEKLDGYRAIYYNNENGGGFISRTNNEFVAPKNYLQQISSRLPKDIVLDGELYIKKGDFAGMGVVRKKVPNEREWSKVKYIVFDLPNIHKPYYERYEILKRLIKDIPNVELIKQTEIKSESQLLEYHRSIVEAGGEGTILRNPNSYYSGTRSKELLKFKDDFDDEVIVQDFDYGTGRNSDVMGKLIVKWAPHAKKKYTGTFKVGSGFTDYERANWKKLFPKGTMITIKYMILQPEGKPREPRYLRIRNKII